MNILLFAFPIFGVGLFLIFAFENQNPSDVIENGFVFDSLVDADKSIEVSMEDNNWGTNWKYQHSCKGQELFVGVFDFEILSYCNI